MIEKSTYFYSDEVALTWSVLRAFDRSSGRIASAWHPFLFLGAEMFIVFVRDSL